jgi:hypothetical protein
VAAQKVNKTLPTATSFQPENGQKASRPPQRLSTDKTRKPNFTSLEKLLAALFSQV